MALNSIPSTSTLNVPYDAQFAADSQGTTSLSSKSRGLGGANPNLGGSNPVQNPNPVNNDSFNVNSTNLSELMFDVSQIAEKWGSEITKMSAANAAVAIGAQVKQWLGGLENLLQTAATQLSDQISAARRNASSVSQDAIGTIAGGVAGGALSIGGGVAGDTTGLFMNGSNAASSTASGSGKSASAVDAKRSGIDSANANYAGQIFGVIDGNQQQALNLIQALLQKLSDLASSVQQGVSAIESGANQQVS